MYNSGVSHNKAQGNKIKDEKVSEEQFRKKITEQAHRLTKLESYNNILEKKLRQLVPNIALPVKESDLKLVTDLKKENDNKQNSQYLSIIKQKDSEIVMLNKKLESLEARVRSGLVEPKSRSFSPKGGIDFPPSDRLPNEKLREAYDQLYEHLKELSNEKENALESLRNETINNEEQRNLIEILRQTIESNIIKHGLGPLIQSYKQGRDVSNVDIMCDIARANADCDKYRKELVMSQVLITELKQEIEYLKKVNEDLSIKKERLKESLDQEMVEMEEAKDRIRLLEEEKEHVELNLEELKKFNEKLRGELNETFSVLSRMERDNNDKDKKLIEISNRLENQTNLKTNIQEYDKKYKKIAEDYEKIIKDKVSFQNNFQHQTEDMREKDNEIRRLKGLLDQNEDLYEKDKRTWTHDNENLCKENNLLETQLNNLSNKLKDVEYNLKKAEDKLALTERHLKDTRNQHEQLKLNYDDLKKQTDREREVNLRTIQDLERALNTVKNDISALSKEKESIYANYLTTKNDSARLSNDLASISRDYEALRKTNIETNEQYESFMREYNAINEDNITMKHDIEALQEELRYTTDKYDKDMGSKTTECNNLNNEYNSVKRENTLMKQKLSELNEYILFNNRLNSTDSMKLDNLAKILKTKDNQLNELIVKEAELTRNCENLNRKIDALLREREEINNDLNHKTRELNDIAGKNSFLTSTLEEKERALINLEDTRRVLQNQLKEVSHKTEEYQRKFEKVYII
jgi:chromosome segregation ATPase